jgi:diaphanous 1
MSESSLIVPVIVPTGSLHFATVKPDGTVQDVVDSLLAQPEVTSEILDGLGGAGWALQKIRIEKSGRQWEEEDLEKLGDGQSYSLCLLRRTTEPLTA